MTKQQRAIAYLMKQRDIEVQMLNDMKNYIKSTEKDYNKIRQAHLDQIELLNYAITRLS